MLKKCSNPTCIEKQLIDFYYRKDTGKYSNLCISCYNARSRDKYLLNKQNEAVRKSEYYQNNKEKILSKQHQYYNENKSEIIKKQKEYVKDNPERKKYNKEYQKTLRKNPEYKMRSNIGRRVREILSSAGHTKNGKSLFEYLSYSAEELRQHIENQFEPWMNWNNWGVYRSEQWNDNDSSTWVWNIDHIIPQSDLPYTSMEDENFKKCWSLDNLRPLSAKLNVQEGSARTRHKSKSY